MNGTLEFRKVIIGIVLTLLWIFTFLFISDTLIIDWLGDNSATTALKPVLGVIGILIIFFYHQFYPSSTETNKLSWTVVLTLAWLALVIFYPFSHTNLSSGAVGFFALIGGLAVCVLWVRFFSDEIVA